MCSDHPFYGTNIVYADHIVRAESMAFCKMCFSVFACANPRSLTRPIGYRVYLAGTLMQKLNVLLCNTQLSAVMLPRALKLTVLDMRVLKIFHKLVHN